MDIADKVFLMTGCASGMGKHLSGVFQRHGALLLLTDVNIDALDAHVTESGWSREQVRTMRLDVREPMDWEQAVRYAVDGWGRIDVLMNIAGISFGAYGHEAEYESIDRHVDINLKGTMYGCRAAGAQMVKQGAGHIVNFCSLAGLAPIPAMCIYNATKFGVRGFSLALSQELTPHGVDVTILCPDAVDTPLLHTEAEDPRAAFNFSGGRVLTVEDIERAVMERVLPKRPLEVLLPRGLGMLTRILTANPQLGLWLKPYFERTGRRNQQRYLEALRKRQAGR